MFLLADLEEYNIGRVQSVWSVRWEKEAGGGDSLASLARSGAVSVSVVANYSDKLPFAAF